MMSGIQPAIRSKCGMTRTWGRTPSPSTAPLRGWRSDGTQPDIAIAPALQPASAAPDCQAVRIASHTGVPRRVSARCTGLPPDR